MRSTQKNQFNTKPSNPIKEFEFYDLTPGQPQPKSPSQSQKSNTPTPKPDYKEAAKPPTEEEEAQQQQQQTPAPPTFIIPKGHILIQRNASGPGIQIQPPIQHQNPHNQSSSSTRAIISAITKNHERFRNEFIEIHGADTYNRLYHSQAVFEEDEDASDVQSISGNNSVGSACDY